MKSAGANELVAAVERATGYRVTVDTVEAIAETIWEAVEALDGLDGLPNPGSGAGLS